MYTDKSLLEILNELFELGFKSNEAFIEGMERNLYAFLYDENDLRVNIYYVTSGDIMGVIVD